MSLSASSARPWQTSQELWPSQQNNHDRLLAEHMIELHFIVKNVFVSAGIDVTSRTLLAMMMTGRRMLKRRRCLIMCLPSPRRQYMKGRVPSDSNLN